MPGSFWTVGQTAINASSPVITTVSSILAMHYGAITPGSSTAETKGYINVYSFAFYRSLHVMNPAGEQPLC